jgi:hypothetical protein
MQVEDNNFTIGVLTQAVPAEERPRFLVNIYPWLNHRARKALKNHWATGECSPNVLRARFEAVEAIVEEELETFKAFGNKPRTTWPRQLVAYVMYWQFVRTKQMRLANLGAHFSPTLKHPEVLYSVRRVEWVMFKDEAFRALVNQIALHVDAAGHGSHCLTRLAELPFNTKQNGVG